MAKEWRPFDDECPHCGAGAEIFTDAEKGFAYEDDDARCEECKMPGTVMATENVGVFIIWHDDPKCTCEWCKNHPPQ